MSLPLIASPQAIRTTKTLHIIHGGKMEMRLVQPPRQRPQDDLKLYHVYFSDDREDLYIRDAFARSVFDRVRLLGAPFRRRTFPGGELVSACCLNDYITMGVLYLRNPRADMKLDAIYVPDVSESPYDATSHNLFLGHLGIIGTII